MKLFIILLAFIVSGYFLFIKLKSKPASFGAPPPALAPGTSVHLDPAPVISEEEQSKVVRTTNDEDPEVRWQAILLLDKMKAPAAYPVMFDKLRKDMEPALRVKIVTLLGDRPGKEVAQNLVFSTKDSAPEVRIAALQALEKSSDYNTASAIAECLKDGEDSVRLQALKTLNALQDRRTLEVETEQKRQEEMRKRQTGESEGKK